MGCGRTHPWIVFGTIIYWMGPAAGLPEATYSMAGSHVSISPVESVCKALHVCCLGGVKWAPHKGIYVGPSRNLVFVRSALRHCICHIDSVTAW